MDRETKGPWSGVIIPGEGIKYDETITKPKSILNRDDNSAPNGGTENKDNKEIDKTTINLIKNFINQYTSPEEYNLNSLRTIDNKTRNLMQKFDNIKKKLNRGDTDLSIMNY